MKLRFEVSAREVGLFKKIIADLKRVSQTGDIYCTFEDEVVIFHNYYNFDESHGLLFFMKLMPQCLFIDYLIESKRPANQIILRFIDEVSKFNSNVSTIPDNKTPLFFLSKEEDKKFIKLKHEIQSGVSSVESKTEIDLVLDPHPNFATFDVKKLEIRVPMKSLIPFLEEGHSLESSLTLKIAVVGETASVSLKINNCGFKVDLTNLLIIVRGEEVAPDFTHTHVLGPKILKSLANACSFAEYGFLNLFEDNILGIIFQHCGKIEDGLQIIKAQEVLIIPQLATQDGV